MPLTGTATNSDKLDGYDSTDFQPISDELTALDQLEDTEGFVKKTGDAAYSIDTSTYLVSGSSLLLDQTTPQQIIGGQPEFTTGLHAGSTNQLDIDASGNLETTGDITASSFIGVNQAVNTLIDNYGWYDYPSLNMIALFDGTMTNKFRFISATSQEESTDGINWTPSTRGTATSLAQVMICEGDITDAINAIPVDTIGVYGAYRLTWDVVGITGSLVLTHLYLHCAPNLNETTILIEGYHNTTGWGTIASGVTDIGSGNISFRHSNIEYGASASYYSKVRFTVSNTHQVGTGAFIIYSIGWWGIFPNGRRTVEKYDRYKNATFPAGIAGTTLTSSIATGTAPLAITSTTLVSNLNADQVDGYHSSSFQSAGNELSALQALADTAGFLKKTGDGAYSIDTATYQASGNELTALQSLADTAGFIKKVGDASYTIDTNTYTDDTNINIESISDAKSYSRIQISIGSDCYDESPLEAEVKGLTLTNLVTNGDIEKTFPTGTTSATNIQTFGTALPIGKYYLAYTITQTGTTNTRNTPQIKYTDGTTIQQSSTANYNTTTGRKSWIFDATKTIYGLLWWGHTLDVATKINNIVLINLAATYGAGNEPATAAQMDLIAPSWFNGTANVVNPVLNCANQGGTIINTLALTGTLRSVFDTATLYRDRLYRDSGVWKIDRYVNPSTGLLQTMATEDAVITGNPIVYKNGTIYYTTTVIAPQTDYTYALNFRASYNRSEEYARYGSDNSLKLNQTTQQTTVGTFKFPIVATSEIKTNSTAPTDLTITTGAAKTLVLGTVVYKDMNIAGMLLHSPASSNPGVDTFRDKNGADTTIVTYAFGIDEYLSGGFELQHDYKEGTDLVFHVHWQGIAAPTGTDNVQWRLTYIVTRDNVVLEPAVTIDSVDTAFDTQYACKRTEFSAITGTTFKIGDQFMFNLYRVAATGDAYAGDALIETAGIHYQIDAIGSRTATAK